MNLFPSLRTRKTALQVLAACSVTALSAPLARAQTVPAWELKPPSQQQNTQSLFRDDFNALDQNVWDVHGSDWAIQGTVFGKTPQIVNQSGTTFSRFGIDTFNPNQPGQRSLGSEIWSKAEYQMGKGVEFEARVRGTNVPRGLVFAFYTYRKRDFNNDFDQEELDYEFLSNYINDPANKSRLWLNIWNGANTQKATQPLVQGLDDQGLAQPTLDQTAWNTYTVRWLNDRVQWWVNDHLVRTETQLMPDDRMSLCFNIWHADNWSTASSSSFVLAPTAAQNQNFYFDVDYVRVRELAPDSSSGFVGNGQGLTGSYFANPDYSSPQFAAVAPRLNFDLGTRSPNQARLNNADNTWSARWQGEIQAQFTQTYTFSLLHDGKATLKIGNTNVINNVDHGTNATESTGTISLVAGQRYPITLSYAHNGGNAKMQLNWSSSSTPKQLVPQSQMYAPLATTPTLSPAGGNYYSAQNVVISSGQAGVELHYTLDGSEPQLSGPTINNGSFVRIDGNRRLRVRAWVEGFVPSEIADATYTITFDTQAPNVSVSAPLDNQLTNALPQISGTISEGGGSGLASLTGRLMRSSDGKFWNGSDWVSAPANLNLTQTNGGTQWNLNTAFLGDGAYSFLAFAADGAGNTAQSPAIDFTLDKSAPTVAISAPVDTYSYRGLTQATGTAADAVSGVASVQMQLTRTSDGFNWDGRNWTAAAVTVPAVGTTNWNWNLPALSDGYYALRAIAIDAAGNQATSAPAGFYLDNTKPLVAIASPNVGATNVTTSALSGTASDAAPGIAAVSATLQRASDNGYWNGSAWAANAVALPATGRENWSLGLPALDDGTYVAVVTASDFIGNLGTASVTWTLDRSGPIVEIISPEENAPLPASGLQSISGTVSDGSGVANVALSIMSNGQNWNGAAFVNEAAPLATVVNGNNWALNAGLPTAPGAYLMTASATDALGNVAASAPRQFVILAAPVPTATPLPTETPVATVTPVPTVVPTPTVAPDRIAPTGSFTTPTSGAILRALPALRGKMTDNEGGSGVAGALVTIQRFDGKTWSGNSWESSLQRVTALSSGNDWGFNSVPTRANLPDGVYRMAVWPLDRAGNRGLNIISVRIDAAPPQLAWAAPTPGGNTLDKPLIYAVRAVDPGGLVAVEMAIQRLSDGAYWNGREWVRALANLKTQYGGAYWVLRSGAPSADDLAAGNYVLLAVATDRAGNQSIARQALTIRPSAPTTQFSPVRVSRSAVRPAEKALDLFFTGPLQIASLSRGATFRVRVNSAEAEIADKSYQSASSQLTLLLSGEIPAGARVEVAWQGVRDARGVLLADGYNVVAAP